MTIESFQDTLFEDPIGLRFRHAREKARLSQENVAQSLKLPVAVLDAIEREDWARLGAPIFVRSYVGSYAKLLGLPATLADEVVRGKPAPTLHTVGSAPSSRRAMDRSLTNLGYLAMTVAIVGAVVMLALYFQKPRGTAENLPLDPPPSYSAAEPAPPVMASLTPSLPDAAPVAAPVSSQPPAASPLPDAGDFTVSSEAGNASPTRDDDNAPISPTPTQRR